MRPTSCSAVTDTPSGGDRLLERGDLDSSGFHCCGNEDLYPFGCDGCGRLMASCSECGTLYDDLADLAHHGRPINHFEPAAPMFHCPTCRRPFEYFFIRDGKYKVTMARWIAAGFGHLLDPDAPRPPALRSVLASAEGLGARHVPGGHLSGVVILFAEQWLPKHSRWQFEFQRLQRRMFRSPGLNTCWVEVCLEPHSVRLMSSGTYGPQQIEQLAAIPGFEFPLRPIDVAAVRLEVADVLAGLARPGGLPRGAGELTLSICIHEGRLAWRVLQDAPRSGVRTLILDAADGRVLYDRGSVPGPETR